MGGIANEVGGSGRARRGSLAIALVLTVMSLIPATTLAIGAGSPPTNTSPPSISGTPQVGQPLSCSQGSWADSPTSFAYQWNSNGTAVAGASAATYTVAAGDAAHQITCSVTATNIDGSNTATSAAVTATAPTGTGSPLPGGGTQVQLPNAKTVIELPSNKRCASKRKFRIRIKKVAGVTFASASVFVNGKRVKTVKQSRLTAPVDLRGLPKGRFAAKIVVTTSDGRKLSHTRKYRTCASKRGGKRRHRL